METKLDLVLRDFAEKEGTLRNFREDTIRASSKGAGVVVSGLLGGAVGGAISSSVKIGKAVRDLNKAQEYLDSVGGVDNLTDEQVESLFSKINKGAIAYPIHYKKYIPSNEWDRLYAKEEEVIAKYPLNKSMKRTPEYKQNEALRIKEINKINIQRARALLKYTRLGEPIKK